MDNDSKGETMDDVEFLYSPDCPSYRPALALLREVLTEERLPLEIRMVSVDTEFEAHRAQFPGSPTIRVHGQDIERAKAPPIGLTCRTYRRPDGTMSPVPSKEAIRQAVRGALEAAE
jgi:hypothetical protein